MYIFSVYFLSIQATSELHLKLSRASVTKILKVLAKRRNERMQCVDEFAADAYDVSCNINIKCHSDVLCQSWKQIIAVIDELREIHGLLGDGEERSLKRWIRIARSHLEGSRIIFIV